ncbi:MAG: radical SAM protein [Gammaproteobacteria bacterium]|nr:radical SAM protein [Gammaproteobacteria bacterium]
MRRSIEVRAERFLAKTAFSGLFGSVKNKNKEWAPLENRFCPNPFRQLDLEEDGTAFTCCSAWLPTPMGNLKHKNLDELWNGHTMQKIRESIYDGSFRYCRHDRCPKIQNDSLPTLQEGELEPDIGSAVKNRSVVLDTPPLFLHLCNDRSCNLICPSCRTERINHSSGPEYQSRLDLQNRLLKPYLEGPRDQAFTLSITGSGDAFASKVFRKQLFTLDGRRYPNMQINLQTNGVLLTPKTWRRMHAIHDNIATVLISIDAATKATYDITRRGGHWEILMENCARLGEFRASGEIKYLRFDFVVQLANFTEMPAFVELSRNMGADCAYFSRMLDWGTWTRKNFLQQCVWEQDHPEYGDFLKVLADPRLHDSLVDTGNLSEYFAMA